MDAQKCKRQVLAAFEHTKSALGMKGSTNKVKWTISLAWALTGLQGPREKEVITATYTAVSRSSYNKKIL